MVATVLVARFTDAKLDKGLAWSDEPGLSMLAGIGFTVSLLMGELSFGLGTAADSHDKVAVLAGSLLAAVLASVPAESTHPGYKRIAEAEGRDCDADGIPDAYAASAGHAVIR